MNIDCCKSYIGKQIIGLLPGGAEECLYVLGINAEDYGSNFFVDWTIDGEVFSDYLAANFSGNIYQNSTGYESCFIYYIGTQPTTINVTTELATIPFTINKVTDFEGGSCDLVCYQASFDYGFEWRFIDYFASGGVLPEQLGSAIPIDDATILYNELYTFLGPQISVTSVWNGSQYVVTINNAFNLGGFRLGDGAPVYTTFTALPCEITPPTPVPLELLTAYPGATAGYSVRKLSTTYSGAAIRVRRSSDNTEQDIGFSGVNLDETALTTFVGAGNGFVTKWYDQGGSGRDFLQSTANEQPRIVSSGTIDKANTIPSLFFGTANIKYMEVALANESAFDFTNTYSIYIAAKPANQAGSQVIFGKGQSLFAQDGYYIDVGASNSYLLINNNTSSPTTSAILSNTSINLGCYGYNLSSGNGKSSFNGTIINNNTGLISAKLSNRLPTIGVYSIFSGSTDFDGWFSELIVYPTDQSANRVGIETNITNYYSI
jgi:hypothetical protein